MLDFPMKYVFIPGKSSRWVKGVGVRNLCVMIQEVASVVGTQTAVIARHTYKTLASFAER